MAIGPHSSFMVSFGQGWLYLKTIGGSCRRAISSPGMIQLKRISDYAAVGLALPVWKKLLDLGEYSTKSSETIFFQESEWTK